MIRSLSTGVHGMRNIVHIHADRYIYTYIYIDGHIVANVFFWRGGGGWRATCYQPTSQ